MHRPESAYENRCGTGPPDISPTAARTHDQYFSLFLLQLVLAEEPHVFQRAIAKARLVHGHNLQVLIQAGLSWLGTTGVAIAFREWRSQRPDRPLNNRNLVYFHPGNFCFYFIPRTRTTTFLTPTPVHCASTIVRIPSPRALEKR